MSIVGDRWGGSGVGGFQFHKHQRMKEPCGRPWGQGGGAGEGAGVLEVRRTGPTTRVSLKGGWGVGLWGGPPPPSGDPELLEAPKAPKKFFGLN